MLFGFLKYIRPTWYFNLSKLNGETVFPMYQDLPKGIQKELILDTNYVSETAKENDLSWQAFQKGTIGNTASLKFDSNSIPLLDEYRFVRKYHKPQWATYCLLVRLLTFKNPIKEIKAWKQTKHVKHQDIFKHPLATNWDVFQSDLLKKQPKVSVIIPTLNRYTYLKDVLSDLEQQDYSNFDVLVIDQSEPYQKEFYSKYNLNLILKNQKEKALWLARNTAIKLSDAKYFLLFDDDSRVHPEWISNHIKGLDFFNADISSGQSISKVGEQLPLNYQFFRISDLLDTGNVLIKRYVFEKIGLFDRQFEKQRMGDGEFGMRAYLHGFLNISNPYATRLHLKVSTGGLRQMGSWDAFRSNKIFAPKPIPSVLYFYRNYFDIKLVVLELIKSLPPSVMPYRFKKNKTLMIIGLLLSVLFLPLLIFQIGKSWILSSKKIKEGSKIKNLDGQEL